MQTSIITAAILGLAISAAPSAGMSAASDFGLKAAHYAIEPVGNRIPYTALVPVIAGGKQDFGAANARFAQAGAPMVRASQVRTRGETIVFLSPPMEADPVYVAVRSVAAVPWWMTWSMLAIWLAGMTAKHRKRLAARQAI